MEWVFADGRIHIQLEKQRIASSLIPGYQAGGVWKPADVSEEWDGLLRPVRARFRHLSRMQVGNDRRHTAAGELRGWKARLPSGSHPYHFQTHCAGILLAAHDASGWWLSRAVWTPGRMALVR